MPNGFCPRSVSSLAAIIEKKRGAEMNSLHSHTTPAEALVIVGVTGDLVQVDMALLAKGCHNR